MALKGDQAGRYFTMTTTPCMFLLLRGPRLRNKKHTCCSGHGEVGWAEALFALHDSRRFRGFPTRHVFTYLLIRRTLGAQVGSIWDLPASYCVSYTHVPDYTLLAPLFVCTGGVLHTLQGCVRPFVAGGVLPTLQQVCYPPPGVCVCLVVCVYPVAPLLRPSFHKGGVWQVWQV